jgi:diaminopimelate epimerase
MKFEFTKMHALGNDYILIDGFKYKGLLKEAARLARKMSDRHFGAGGDGVIFLLPAEKKSPAADVRMRMFNTDGTEAEMCGNGIRQLALFAYQNRIIRASDIGVDTPAGLRKISLKKNKKGAVTSIAVNMGAPVLDPALIPAVATRGRDGYCLANIDVAGRNFDFTLVSMGNPHSRPASSTWTSKDTANPSRTTWAFSRKGPTSSSLKWSPAQRSS